jgi:site-specific DNA recombinase
MLGGMSDLRGTARVDAQLRAGVYARLSETYDAAESVPTELKRGQAHAGRRGWRVADQFKDDGYSAFKEITRDGFADLIEAIERGEIDVVVIRDVDRLTRNLADWNQFEKTCVKHGVLLSPYTGGRRTSLDIFLLSRLSRYAKRLGLPSARPL